MEALFGADQGPYLFVQLGALRHLLAAASVFLSHALGREIYNRLDVFWHLLVDFQREKENFLFT